MLAAAPPAVWLGLLTSLSPCPLAANIAALAFVTRDVDKTGRALAMGSLYAIGRSFSYVLVAFLIVRSFVGIPGLSFFLQTTAARLLGPLLVLIGMFLLGLLSLPFSGSYTVSQETAEKLRRKGMAGAFALGVVLAVCFCPVSAALYFGSLIPLAITHASGLLLPALYGIGTALPVIFFAAAISLGAHRAARAFRIVSSLEAWGNRITGVIFILLGIYLSLAQVFGVL